MDMAMVLDMDMVIASMAMVLDMDMVIAATTVDTGAARRGLPNPLSNPLPIPPLMPMLILGTGMAMAMVTDMDIMDMAMATTVPTMADTTEATGAKPPSPSKISTGLSNLSVDFHQFFQSL